MMSGKQVPILQRIASQYPAFAYEQLVISTSVVPLTATTYISGDRSAQTAFISCEDANIRFRYDGINPTGTVGHLLYAGETLVLSGHANIAAFRAIRAAGVDAELNVTYEG
jgi:hypothetical protein